MKALVNERALFSASSRSVSSLRRLLLADRRAVVLVVATALGACGGGGSGPSGPSGPQPGGTLSGRYLLTIQPSASCNTLPRGPFTFPMIAAAAGTAPYPGVQVVLEGDASRLELELLYTNFTLRGGLGTVGDGALASEGLRIFIRTIGTGSVLQTTGGRGEVATGTMMGNFATGNPDDTDPREVCDALDHTFTLKVR